MPMSEEDRIGVIGQMIDIVNALEDVKAQIAISNKLKVLELHSRGVSTTVLRQVEFMIDKNEATERVIKSSMPIRG